MKTLSDNLKDLIVNEKTSVCLAISKIIAMQEELEEKNKIIEELEKTCEKLEYKNNIISSRIYCIAKKGSNQELLEAINEYTHTLK